tara:strand:+ start:858 stop:1406 length:549 start_codon:yes stop_codon:yes gene_type:complete
MLIICFSSFYNFEIYSQIRYENSNQNTQIEIIDIDQLEKKIKESNKKYKIIFYISKSCSSSIMFFPKIIELINNHSDIVELYPIIGDRLSEITEYEAYLKHIQYFNTVFILDTEKYGNKKNPFKRLDILTQKLCLECEYKKMGFSSFFVINDYSQVILHNNWTIPHKERYLKLKKILENHND